MTTQTYKHCMPAMLLEVVGEDKETFLAIYEIFLNESAQKSKLLREAAESRDVAQLGAISHSLKGVVGPFGAETLMKILQDIETECRQNECVCGPERLAGIDAELVGIVEEMEQYIRQM